MKKVEIVLKNLLLKLLLLLAKQNKKSDTVTFSDKSKVLFIRLNRIGDALITTPLLKQIKDQLRINITVLADKSNHFIFSNNPSVDNVIIFNKGINGILEVLRIIRKEKYDAVVDLHDDVSTTVTYILALCSARNKFGLKKENEIVYSKTIKKLDPVSFHVVDRIMELARLFNLEPCTNEANIVFCPEKLSIEKIDKTLKRKFLDQKPLIGVNISAGSISRFWGVEKFQKLISFISSYDVNVIIICSPKDINNALQIARNDSQKIFYSPSFDEFASMVSRVDLLFTPDTSIIHLASAYKVPVFGLYVKYNTNDMIWSPYRSDFDCIITEEHNLTNITVEQTIKKLKPFIEKHL